MSKIAYGYYGPPPSSPWQHRLIILDGDGNELYNAVHSAVYYSWNQDATAMDKDGNIFITGRYVEKIKKLDIDGNLLTEIDFSTSFQCAIAPNGDFWTYDWIGAVNYLHKRNPDTLAIIDTITINNGDHTGMAFDTDGFLYMVDHSNDNIEKWNVVTKTRVTSRALPAGDLSDRSTYSSLAIVGSVVFLVQWNNDEGDIFTCPTDLSADFTANDVNDEFPASNDYVNFITAYQGTHIIVEGYVSNVKTIVKYTTDFTKVWEITVTDEGAGIWITAYPFILPPTVTTQAATDVLSTSITGNGNITNTGGEKPHTRGLCYKEGTVGDPTTADDTVFDNGGGSYDVEAYTKAITGLTKGTDYRVRAYAINTAGTSYGDTVQFTTDKEPTVTTQVVSSIGDVTAIGNGNITDLGGDTPTKRGICYNKTGSPTVADSKTEETGEFETGAFTETLINLSPETLYYAKAYAMNEVGYSYGSEVSFTTELVEWINYGEWVKFVTAAPGESGDKPLGYKNDVCSDNSGYTYILNRSLLDDGASYKSHFVLSTDLSGKKTLHTNKRLLDIFSYFANKGTGTAKVYVKRDTEPEWQEAGEISLTGKEEIVIQHIPVDFLAKTYLIKFTFENDFEFIGSIFESIPIGDR